MAKKRCRARVFDALVDRVRMNDDLVIFEIALQVDHAIGRVRILVAPLVPTADRQSHADEGCPNTILTSHANPPPSGFETNCKEPLIYHARTNEKTALAREARGPRVTSVSGRP
jgi:hypothetical protein